MSSEQTVAHWQTAWFIIAGLFWFVISIAGKTLGVLGEAFIHVL